MSLDRWSPERDPDVLGVPVHGPAVVARSPGIAMAVRCIFAHPLGLQFDFVLRAEGVQAEAAARQTFGKHYSTPRPAGEPEERWPHSEPELRIEFDGKRVVSYPDGGESSGSEVEFSSEMRITVDGLPTDGLVTVAASWPEAGLAEGTATLNLDSLADLESRTIRLP